MSTEILMKSVHTITISNITLKKEKIKYDVRQRRFTSEDLRPVGGEDYEY